jgi:hypothetical protein
MAPVRVRSMDEEEHLLGKCPCGGEWKLMSEDVVPLQDRWYDALIMRCPTCGEWRRAIFDISAFFEPHGQAWSRP